MVPLGIFIEVHVSTKQSKIGFMLLNIHNFAFAFLQAFSCSWIASLTDIPALPQLCKLKKYVGFSVFPITLSF